MYSRILVPVDLDNVEKLSKALSLAGQTAQANYAEVFYVDVVDAVPTMSASTEGDRMAVRLKDFVAAQTKQYHIKANDQVALRGDLHLNVGADIIKAAKEADSDGEPLARS